MKTRILVGALAGAIALAGCSFQNKYERAADRITVAVQNDNLGSVKDEIVPNADIPRAKLAQWSDELSQQGKLLSVKETTPCTPAGWHCFDVKFEKHAYTERLLMNDQGKVADWRFHIANGG